MRRKDSTLFGRDTERRRLVVAVTGAQGVGKSTFCNRVVAGLTERGVSATLVDGLGDAVRSLGIEVGSGSSKDTIAAVYAAHLHREHAAVGGDVVILDRCTVDALAYVRALELNTPLEEKLYEEISRVRSTQIDLLVHLELRGLFVDTGKPHETTELRARIAAMVPDIIQELGVTCTSVYAADDEALAAILDQIERLVLVRGWSALARQSVD